MSTYFHDGFNFIKIDSRLSSESATEHENPVLTFASCSALNKL